MAIFKIVSNGKQVEEFDEAESRKDLRVVFENHGLRFIEANLRLVEHNVPAGKGSIDTLAVDGSKRPVIIQYIADVEGSSDNLIQSLSCANHVQQNWKDYAGMIIRKLGGLRPEEPNFDNLRLILVAPGFDSQVLDAVRMVAPHMKLVTYTVQKTTEGRAMTTTTLFDSEAKREHPAHDDSSIDSHFSGRYKSMRPAFEKLCREIKNRLKRITVLPERVHRVQEELDLRRHPRLHGQARSWTPLARGSDCSSKLPQVPGGPFRAENQPFCPASEPERRGRGFDERDIASLPDLLGPMFGPTLATQNPEIHLSSRPAALSGLNESFL